MGQFWTVWNKMLCYNGRVKDVGSDLSFDDELFACGSVKYFSQKSLRGLARTKSASNGGVLRGDLQMLHVHVLLVAPLSTSYMTQSGTD